MRASVKWLKDYVDFTQQPEELGEMLTMAGVPVEGIAYLGKDIDMVVTGKLVKIEKHPNADKLQICKVDVGAEVLTIVTGASNVAEGQIVPVALAGAQLPSGLKIKESKLRGVMSSGMLCSATELNLDPKMLSAEEKSGILILDHATAVGRDIKQVLGLDDVVLEFELTANRADCFSVLGLAREIAVLTGGQLKKPMLSLKETGDEKTAGLVRVEIKDPDLCSRFAGRVLRNVKVGPSPEWLKQRIQAAGMRSINNVVDVTNFVMLELGQPMHAYDYHLLARHTIVVRKAQPGERMTTLDGVKRELSPDMLVIADAVQAVGIAGVMGGLATEVTANTQTVLLEAAAFNNVSIRRTAKALGLRSEASGRFERGVDTANVIRALDRAAGLLEEMGACQVCQGIVDVYPDFCLPRQVTFTPAQINRHLGTNVPAATMADILRRLEFEVETTKEKFTATVPTWRADVSCPADIAEEVARIYGFNHIPSTTPGGNMMSGGQSYEQTIGDKIKTILAGAGLDEIISFSFTHPAVFDQLNLPADSSLRTAVPILNPITDDFPLLRTTLTGGVLETVARNLARKNEDIKIYELGPVYLPRKLPLTELPDEPQMLCGALSGRRNELAWNNGRDNVDFYDVKGVAETLLQGLGIKAAQVAAGEHYALHPGKTAVFSIQDDVLGSIGEVHPAVAAAFNLKRKVFLFEFNAGLLAKHAVLLNQYEVLPKYPAMARDLALVLAEDITAKQVDTAIKSSAGALLTNVRLFDVYTGEQVPAGMKSLAFSLTFQSQERTLTDAEVDAHYQNIVAHLEKTLQAKLRS
ncbi:phenylalanine--tRNA ligase subunit beta|uniref:Phenylalanine--tRNA ligase beta subunit n=1 Tax=Dendrosporobacter quercicolus TaxID=146817 RepID=A0A1G9KHZ5_9FIRM|nr:phenylalanine--tRNA ligase subunit beta [Dendrosporobacter quercicolus]NSL49733.1 phenylalanine--tRNA ligase subunit beta [Dendrosporobacter quercicolus DSM 1736]SDL49232.1 phenylalanyl-tRNA synthetase beta subunit [Dendrosporobacter quercicolus]